MLTRMRAWLIAVLMFGLVGTFIELLLLAHYEEPWQVSPLALIASAIGALAWHHLRPGAASVRVLRVLMALFVLSGAVGTALHMRGAAQFQLEINPSLPRRELFTKIMRAQSPPALAPGVMMQLGLIGLVALYREPHSQRSDT
jgi:hypothetical protein